MQFWTMKKNNKMNVVAMNEMKGKEASRFLIVKNALEIRPSI